MKASDGVVYDLTGLGRPLPLALARKAAPSDGPPVPSVLSCARCGIRYFTRPPGSALAEDGHCRECATGAESLLPKVERRNVATFQERSRARGGRR